MKLLVIGLEGAVPERILGDERLVNIRQLMDVGCYGPLEGVIPSSTVCSWMCLATGQDPGSLAVTGPREEAEGSHLPPSSSDSPGTTAAAIWDVVEQQGKHAIVLGPPPGRFHPPALDPEIRTLFRDDPADIRVTGTPDRRLIRERVEARARARFDLIRKVLSEHAWDYLQFVETGLAAIQHAYADDQDTGHAFPDPASPHWDMVVDYYRYLDEEIGTLLELLTEDTVVLVISPHGMNDLDGAGCAQLGGLEWSSSGEDGHQTRHPNGTGSRTGNVKKAQHGVFVLASPGLTLQGPLEGVHLRDIAPTLLELGEYEVPDEMAGRSLATGRLATSEAMLSGQPDEEELIRERLRGLGYIA